VTAWPRLSAQIGGQNAISVWAWLITLPVTVLISSVYATTPTLSQVAQWTTALILIQGVLGLMMLVARVTVLPNRPRRPRPVTAITFFAALGLVRALLLQGAQNLLGIGFFDFVERIAFNVASSVVLYAAIAIIVDEFKTDSSIVKNLWTAQESLAELREKEESSLRTVDKLILTEVEGQVLQALNASAVDSARIREISGSVVRGVSHQLVKSEEPDFSWSSVTTASPSRWRAVQLMVQRMRVPNPLIVVVLYQLLVFGTVIARLGVEFALINFVLGAIPSITGLWLMRKFITLPKGAFPRIASFIAGITTVGFIGAEVNAWLWRNVFSSNSVSVPAVTVGLVALALLVSSWVAIAEGREDRRLQLGQALDEQAREVSRIKDIVRERQQSVARFLHGTVQNQLVAASLRGDSAETVQKSISDLFGSYDGNNTSTDARFSLENLLSSWSTVLNLRTRIDQEVWQVLVNHKERQQLLTDIVSEGLTNAVRHATGRNVDIEITAEGQRVNIQMTTESAQVLASVPGIGFKELRSRGAEIELRQDSTAATMFARI